MKETGFYKMPMENYKSKKNLGKALEELAEGLRIHMDVSNHSIENYTFTNLGNVTITLPSSYTS